MRVWSLFALALLVVACSHAPAQAAQPAQSFHELTQDEHIASIISAYATRQLPNITQQYEAPMAPNIAPLL